MEPILPFETALLAFGKLGTTHVWSLIVTVMGDRAMPDKPIAGAELAGLLAPLGVRPEALRVALHRLRKDGWITSEKKGRSSLHRLSSAGLAETRQAAKRIYQRVPDLPESWHLLWAQSNANDGPDHEVIVLGRGLFLGAGQAPGTCHGFLVLQGRDIHLPAWLKTQLGWDELAASYAQLARALAAVSDMLALETKLADAEKAALRILIVHHWRRLLLRHPDLPVALFPTGWQGENCRAKVMDLLDII